MKVRFADDVLADPSAWRELTRIVDGFLEERHVWDIEDPAAIQDSPWLAGDDLYTQGNLDALKKLSVRSFLYTPSASAKADDRAHPRSNAHSLAIVVSWKAAPPETLAPDDARRALEKPVYVVVENGESDRAFLDAMIRAFARSDLRQAIDEGWVEIVSAGGGGEIPKRVRDLVARAGKGPRRILILSDSDRMTPGEPTNTIEKIKACADEHEVDVAILHKREIENYLPVNAFQRVSRKHNSVYDAFCNLTQEQRDHYDMKNGFPKDQATGAPIIPTSQESLFGKLPIRIRKALCGGFGDKVWKRFQDAADRIDAHAVRQTCGTAPDEIENILDAIERLI